MLPQLEAVDADALANVRLFVISGTDFAPWDGKTALPTDNVISWEAFLDSAGDTSGFTWPEFDEKAAAALCYTSGTTGVPKGVAYSHRSTYLHTQMCCQADVLALSGTDW